MLTSVAIAVPIAAGAPWPAVGALAFALLEPWWAAAGVAAWAVGQAASRREEPVGREAGFLDALAAELRTGATWRLALAAAAARVPGLDLGRAVARSQAGLAAESVAPELARALPHLGRQAAAALRLVATSGAPAAAVFGALAEQAAQRAGEARERWAATAQARLSAALVGGAPAALAVVLLATGRARHALAAGGAAAGLLAVGLGLLVAGIGAVALMLRRASR